MPKQVDFAASFVKLKALLEPYAPQLVVVADTESSYYLDTHHKMKNKKPLFFGAVRTSKSYVSFHLMPVYVFPDLLENISPKLKKHMQGKSCFNFKSVDEELFKELAKLTEDAFFRYKAEHFV